MSTLSSHIRGSLVAAVPASTSAAALAVEDLDPAFFRGWQIRSDAGQTNVARYIGEIGGRKSGGKAVRQTVTRDDCETRGFAPRYGAALHLFDNLATGQPLISRVIA